MLSRLGALRWRLTIFYLTVPSVLLLVLGFFLNTQLDQFLLTGTSQRLREAAVQVASKEPPPKQPEGQPLPKIAGDLAKTLARTSMSGLVLDADGKPILGEEKGPRLTGEKFDQLPYDQVIATGRESAYILQGDGTGRILVYALPVRAGGEVEGVLQVSTSLQDTDAILGQLRLFLWLGIAGTIIVATVVGLPLAGLTLRPLERMASAAHGIAQGDLSRRVDLPQGQDEIGRLAESFNQMLDSIEAAFTGQKQSEERTRRFAIDVSHELRTPLTAIGGYVDVLLRGAKDDPSVATRVLHSMRQEIARMSRLVADLLTLDKLDAGRGLSLGPVDVNALLREVFDEARVLAQGQQVHLNENGAFTVQGDRDRLKQAVLNLVDNALRHTPKAGSINLEVGGRDGLCRISVTDTGEGILPEHLPHIFDRFYRADRSRSRQTGSGGLGLAIVKAIVEAHQGRVEVTSQVEHASTFTIYLPH